MQRNHLIRRFLFRLFLLSAIGWVISSIRGLRDVDSWEYPEPLRQSDERTSEDPELFDGEATPRKAASSAHRPFSARRVATSLSFAVLFFAGAALTAGAGDQVARLYEGDEQCMTAQAVEETAAVDETQCADDATQAAAAPAEGPAAKSWVAPETKAPAAIEVDRSEAAPERSNDSWAPASGSSARASSARAPEVASSRPAGRPTLSPNERPVRAQGTHKWVVKRARSAAAAPAEIEGPASAATIWLNRALPDPTPPARRLAPRFARDLSSVARAQRVDWALLLAVLRAQGDRSAVPATHGELVVLAKRLRAQGVGRDTWAAVLAVSGRTGFADRTMALRNYNRAVGLRALVIGLQAAKPLLVKRLLNDRRVALYAGGREDLRRDRVDVRLVVLMRYLAQTFDQVTISSLVSGHRLYSRPGVVSAHIPGHAVDVSALGGAAIFGNQQPGGLTEHAVRAILMLPAEVQPRQVISLLGLGGASFPLSDHADHIHVGY